MNIFTFDTETTGLKSREHNAISIGGTFWKTEDQYVVGQGDFERYLNWKKYKKNFFIPQDTIEVHGITEEYLYEHGEDPVKVYEELYDLLIEFKVEMFNGFNLPFDLNMVYGDLEELISLGLDGVDHKLSKLKNLMTKGSNEVENPILFIDSLIIDRIFRRTVDGLKVKHSLADATEHYGIINEGAHDALFDTHATVQLMVEQLKDLQDRGIEINEDVERRIKNKYVASQEFFKKRNRKDYDPYFLEKETV